MARGDDIQERLVDFAVRIIQLSDNLPKTRAGNHSAGQVLRSGTAPAAHYAEARSAESAKDFQHKLKMYLKELNESRVWFRIVIKSQMFSNVITSPLYQECDELSRIINARINISRQRIESIQ